VRRDGELPLAVPDARVLRVLTRTMRALLCLLVAAVVTAGAGQSPELPVFSSQSAELVVLPVTVVDDDGGFVSDLPRASFTVYDDDRAQPVALFSNEDTPVTVGLVIDSSSSMGGKMGEVIVAALAFARTSNPEDEVFALEFNDGVRDAIPGAPLFATDLARLQRALASMRPEGRTALYDAVVAGLNRVGQGTRPRKILILISDGGDNASTTTRDEVLERARGADATMYTIGLFTDHDLDRDVGVLKKFARATGGQTFLPRAPADLLADCRRIAREIRAGYTIAFVPPEHDGSYHRVRVAVQSERKLHVRTRPGYVAGRAPD